VASVSATSEHRSEGRPVFSGADQINLQQVGRRWNEDRHVGIESQAPNLSGGTNAICRS